MNAGRPIVCRIFERDCAGPEDHRAQFSGAAAEAIVEVDKPDLPPGQGRFEDGYHWLARKPMLRTEVKDRADKAVAAIPIMITASRPVIVVSKKFQHQIQHLQGFAGGIRAHGHLR